MGRGNPKTSAEDAGHAEWSAICERHLTVIETHIEMLDLTRQNLRARMDEMDEVERQRWEMGEVGNWARLLGMMARATEILSSEKEAARMIVCVSCFDLFLNWEEGNWEWRWRWLLTLCA